MARHRWRKLGDLAKCERCGCLRWRRRAGSPSKGGGIVYSPLRADGKAPTTTSTEPACEPAKVPR